MSSIEKEDKDQELKTLQYAWKANYTSRMKHKQNSCWAKHYTDTFCQKGHRAKAEMTQIEENLCHCLSTLDIDDTGASKDTQQVLDGVTLCVTFYEAGHR